ncbi:MAG: nicotinate-nucleotide--dimethylbenzimidazole phosphoribosyltransferase [Alphaproteobacteria bacterium]
MRTTPPRLVPFRHGRLLRGHAFNPDLAQRPAAHSPGRALLTLPPLARLADLADRLAAAPGPDAAATAKAEAREATLTKPSGALGRLEGLTAWLAGWQGRHPPRLDHVRAVVFAGNHGVVARGVSAFPAEVTVQMVANFEAGGAAINQLCQANGVALAVVALDLDMPTADFTDAPAMDEAGCVAALNAGMAAVPADTDLLCVGEMGIANTTSAAALSAALCGGAGADWVGPGTGVDDAGLARKREAVDAGLERHRDAIGDPAQALACLGGRELAAMAGAVLAARLRRIPVLLDGYVCTAAAAVLEKIKGGALDHAVAAHRSAEPAHGRLLERLGKAPLLDLGMRLGEGSGAALAVGLVRAALATHVGMASFAEAGVSGRDRQGG